MQEQNFTPRFSAEQLTQMNAAPIPKAPENMKIDAEQWSQIAHGLNTISKQNHALSRQITELKTRVNELETVLGNSVDRAMKEQKKATEQEIENVMREATKQVGRAAERASDLMDKHSFRDDFLWWLRLILTGLPAVLVLLLWIYVGLGLA